MRHLYGLPPDTYWNHRRRCVRDVYSQYYTYLATKWRETNGQVAFVSLFEYMHRVGLVSRPKDRILIARLPATEYLRGGQCKHECTAALHFLPLMYPGESPEQITTNERKAEMKETRSMYKIKKPHANNNNQQAKSMPSITQPAETKKAVKVHYTAN